MTVANDTGQALFGDLKCSGEANLIISTRLLMQNPILATSCLEYCVHRCSKCDVMDHWCR